MNIQDTLLSFDLFHEKENLVAPAPDVVLNFLQLHLNKVLYRLWPFYDTKSAEEKKKKKQIKIQHFLINQTPGRKFN